MADRRSLLNEMFPSSDPADYGGSTMTEDDTTDALEHNTSVHQHSPVSIDLLPVDSEVHNHQNVPTPALPSSDPPTENISASSSRGMARVFMPEHVKLALTAEEMFDHIKQHYEFASEYRRAISGPGFIIRCKFKNKGCCWALKVLVEVAEHPDTDTHELFDVFCLYESMDGHILHSLYDSSSDLNAYDVTQVHLPRVCQDFLARLCLLHPSFTAQDLIPLFLNEFKDRMNIGKSGLVQVKVRSWFKWRKSQEKKKGTFLFVLFLLYLL